MKLLLVLCCCISVLQAKIVEISHFKHLIDYVDPETLVLIDLDDTLLVPVQMLGSDEWLAHQAQFYQEQGWKEPFQKALAEWEAIRHFTDMKLVEEESAHILQSLQKNGVGIMGLTAQNATLSHRTMHHLKENQIEFSFTAPTQERCFFSADKVGALYTDGILFTSGMCKGDTFFLFCDTIGYHPKKIVFIDDRAKHLSAVEKIALERNIAFIGLRYGYADAHKKAFRRDVAEYQFVHSSFAKLLSDEEAIQRIEGK